MVRKVTLKAKEKYEGMVYPTKSYGDILVLEYINSRDVTVKFLNTGNVRKTRTSELKKGEIRDNEAFPVYAVGVMDIPNELRRCHPVPKEYIIWNGIRQRCYNENNKDKLMSYKDVEMSENFKFYSYFKEWCHQQTGFDQDGWHLDKDILIKGNKVYSDNTCCFVPHEINTLLVKRNSLRGEFPIGVGFYKPLNKYISKLSTHGKARNLGYFSSVEEAFAVYKREKEKYIKEVANKWKDQIDPRVYESLMNWTIEVTD